METKMKKKKKQLKQRSPGLHNKIAPLLLVAIRTNLYESIFPNKNWSMAFVITHERDKLEISTLQNSISPIVRDHKPWPSGKHP